MRTLLILRHAKSSWKNTRLADHDRPLKGRGERDAPRVGEWLRKRDLVPDLMLSSTAKRARQTAQLVIETSGYASELKLRPDFYHAEPEAYIAGLRTVADTCQRVLVVGHNPGLEALVETLTGDWERLPTAALVEIALPITQWSALDEETPGELRNLWTPTELASFL